MEVVEPQGLHNAILTLVAETSRELLTANHNNKHSHVCMEGSLTNSVSNLDQRNVSQTVLGSV